MLEQLETHQKLPERQWSTDDFVGKIKKISGISSPKLTLYRAGNTDICTYCGKPIISGLCWVSGCCFIDGPKGLLIVTRQIFVKMQLCVLLQRCVRGAKSASARLESIEITRHLLLILGNQLLGKR